jgi:hypothetical protein
LCFFFFFSSFSLWQKWTLNIANINTDLDIHVVPDYNSRALNDGKQMMSWLMHVTLHSWSERDRQKWILLLMPLAHLLTILCFIWVMIRASQWRISQWYAMLVCIWDQISQIAHMSVSIKNQDTFYQTHITVGALKPLSCIS